MKILTENKYFIFDCPKVHNFKWFVKTVLYIPLDLMYHLIFAFSRVKPEIKKYKVSICAIFKNESLYLRMD